MSVNTAPEVRKESLVEGLFAPRSGLELKRKSVRGGMVVLTSQGLRFGLQMGAMMILARLLSPQDFGLQGMVVALTGILGLFKDVGLSSATVQREVITHEQISTLFWINAGIGAGLTMIGMAAAPAMAIFYKEPRLYWVAVVSALAFMVNGLGVQHSALLQREMRYVTISKIDVLSLTLSSAVGVAMAWSGFGYWSLIAMALSGALIGVIGVWVAVPWRPGLPRRKSGVRGMLHFGGTITLNSLVVYLGYNAEKILLGRFWGADSLGLYGRAYQLVNLPVQQLHSALYGVAFPALSQIQHDHERLCRSFLRGYSVLLALAILLTVSCAVFAEEIVRIVLGPRWSEAAPLLRLLMPMVLGFALINPFGWFLLAIGRAGRSLKIAFLIAPVVLLAVLIGVRDGPKGVALSYSLALTILVIPVMAWSIHGTGITRRDCWKTVKKPLLSGLLAGTCGWGVKIALTGVLSAIPLLIVGIGVLLVAYVWVLLVAMGQKALYADLLRQIYQRSRDAEDIELHLT